jgi:hypothetical protein
MAYKLKRIRTLCVLGASIAALILSAAVLSEPFLVRCHSQADLQNQEHANARKLEHSGQRGWLYKESHALVIGVSKYEHYRPLPQLADDVNAVSNALEQSGFKVEKLLDPGHDELGLRILTFIREWGEGDQNEDNSLLIYFSGHGCTLGKKPHELGYILPRDAAAYHGDPKDEPALRNTALSMNLFREYARSITAKAALFVFDSCFSGYMFEAINNKSIPGEIVWSKVTAPVRQFITAGTAEQEAPSESIFRRKFVEGIQGQADYNKDGYVTGRELSEFLATEVGNLSHGRQTPLSGRSDPENGGDFVFEVWTPYNSDRGRLRQWPLEIEYVPSGWMGDGESYGSRSVSRYVSIAFEAANIDGKKTVARRIDYKRGPKGWAGIYWQHPEGNWGDKEGYDLSDAKAITFYARGENGDEVAEFISGGVEGGTKKYHDEFKKSLGQQILTKEWQHYTIDLTDVPADKRKHVIGGFAWIGSSGFDSGGKLVVRIADIVVVY